MSGGGFPRLTTHYVVVELKAVKPEHAQKAVEQCIGDRMKVSDVFSPSYHFPKGKTYPEGARGESEQGWELRARIQGVRVQEAHIIQARLDRMNGVTKSYLRYACDGTRESWGEIDMFGEEVEPDA